MKTVKLVLILLICLLASCNKKVNKEQQVAKENLLEKNNLIAILDTIWQTEQTPLRLRDSLMDIYGVESKEAMKQQAIYKKNHIINEKKITSYLNENGWPTSNIAGVQGNLTICNVLQHADLETREYYIPLMKQAVLDNKLEPRFLVRAQDRIATDRGELQIYGGQMKYYPETKTFNVWPIYDPINIDKRRAKIGLGPIAEFLKNRFNFEWNLEEQIKRTEEFERNKRNETKS